MAKLSAKQRENLDSSQYVYPKQKAYPINDKRHARLALAMAARNDSFGSLAKVRAAVKKKYPDLVKDS